MAYKKTLVHSRVKAYPAFFLDTDKLALVESEGLNHRCHALVDLFVHVLWANRCVSG